MEKVLLAICVIIIGVDALTNLLLMRYYPLWEKTKGKEIKELKEQNAELRVFIRELLKNEETY